MRNEYDNMTFLERFYNKLYGNKIKKTNEQRAQLEEIISGYEKLSSVEELKRMMVQVKNTSFSDEVCKPYCEKIQNRMNQLYTAELDGALANIDNLTFNELRMLRNKVINLSKEINNVEIKNKYCDIIDKYITQK